MKDVYIFPCVLIYKEIGGIGVFFPDLDGCVSYGDHEQAAISNAKEALSLHLFGMEQDNDEIPLPTNVKDISCEKNHVIALIDVYMPAFRAKQENKYVKKTLTLPKWLNIKSESAGVNFSQTLQRALKQELGIAE